MEEKNYLVQLQEKVKVPKNTYSEFGGFYYRSADKILEKLKPILHEDGYYVTLHNSLVELAGRVFVMATAFISNGAEIFSEDGYAEIPKPKSKMDEAQATGSATSYANKQALSNLLALDDGKDSDGDEAQRDELLQDVIDWLDNYQGEDKEKIRKQLNDAKEKGKLTREMFEKVKGGK